MYKVIISYRMRLKGYLSNQDIIFYGVPAKGTYYVCNKEVPLHNIMAWVYTILYMYIRLLKRSLNWYETSQI